MCVQKHSQVGWLEKEYLVFLFFLFWYDDSIPYNPVNDYERVICPRKNKNRSVEVNLIMKPVC